MTHICLVSTEVATAAATFGLDAGLERATVTVLKKSGGVAGRWHQRF